MQGHTLIYDRFRGVLLGGAVGDALGRPIALVYGDRVPLADRYPLSARDRPPR
ncbi:hypothetical protein [Nocardia vermiculata]|uniref:hypothetical protein n=1 Tax=Nocardia vermiculata TaxID=257274 RepID=UPI0014440ECF|nr:hypothetical protein [Nocardia vermiculata]